MNHSMKIRLALVVFALTLLMGQSSSAQFYVDSAPPVQLPPGLAPLGPDGRVYLPPPSDFDEDMTGQPSRCYLRYLVERGGCEIAFAESVAECPTSGFARKWCLFSLRREYNACVDQANKNYDKCRG